MTKKVKILLGREVSGYSDEDWYSKQILQESISDWEEISDADYVYLQTNLWRLQQDYVRDYNMSPILIVKDDKPVMERIKSIKDFIQKEKDKEQKLKAAQEAKKLEKAKQRLLKKTQSEKELFEELRKKFEGKDG